ncbi:uncharacterized protein LOC102808331 [Saccoglossus kowalevskii]|uniref:Serine/arginine repetitive matrix protein 2-like n=1 Tax=Saccoglossus kowalevskii TaxID=10224 RepID=A0ABM0M1D9_SACKO|nr:PREDICTED: serine/arginine repetitive matrix protein 2-like [Saccoglossus kowalevskii]
MPDKSSVQDKPSVTPRIGSGDGSPTYRRKTKNSFQKELENSLKDRKKRGLSAGFSDLDISDDSDDGIGSEDELLAQFNQTSKERKDRPGSAKYRGGPLMQTMKQPQKEWQPPSFGAKDTKDEKDTKYKKPDEAVSTKKVSPKPSPRSLRKEDSTPTPSPRSQRRIDDEKPKTKTRLPSPDQKRSPRSFSSETRGQRSFSPNEKSPRLFTSEEKRDQRSFSPGEKKGQRSFSPDEKKSQRSFSPDEKKSQSSFLLDEKPRERSLSPDEKRGNKSTSPADKSRSTGILDLLGDGSRSSPVPKPRSRGTPQQSPRTKTDTPLESGKQAATKDLFGKKKSSPELRRKTAGDMNTHGRTSPLRREGSPGRQEDEPTIIKPKRGLQSDSSWSPPSRRKERLPSTSGDESEDEEVRSISRKAKEKDYKEKKKTKGSTLFGLSSDEDTFGRRERSHDRRSPDRRSPDRSYDRSPDRLHDRRSPDKSHDRRSPDRSHDRRSPDRSHDRRSPDRRSPISKTEMRSQSNRSPSPTTLRFKDELEEVGSKRPPSGRKQKSVDINNSTRRMRYITTDSDEEKEFRNAREKPSPARSRTPRRVIEPKIRTRPLSASGRLSQSLSARSSISDLSARSECFEDSTSIRNAIYEDWYYTKMKQTKENLKKKKQAEEEENKKKQLEKKDKEIEAELSYRCWKEKKDEQLKKQARKEAKKKEMEREKQIEEKSDKKSISEKTYVSWKSTKDEDLKEKQRKKKREEEKKRIKLQEEQNEKQKLSKSCFKKWNSNKEVELQKKEEEKKQQEKENKRKAQQEKKKKEEESLKAYDKWQQQKEKQQEIEKNTIRTPVATVPFKPSGRTVPFGK